MDALSFEPLTPLSFLDRAAAAHGSRIAVVDGASRWTYAELHDRCHRLAGALAPLAEGRPVAVLAPNPHVLLEANFGVAPVDAPDVPLQRLLFPVGGDRRGGDARVSAQSGPGRGVAADPRGGHDAPERRAPTVLSMLAYAPEAAPVTPTVRVATGGAPP